MHITILTIGSRGDVQPYLAFAVGLKNAGYTVRLATHANFEPEIRAYGLKFAVINGNPHSCDRICCRTSIHANQKPYLACTSFC